MSQGLSQFISGATSLVAFVGFVLLAIGAWRLYLLSSQRILIVPIVSITLQLLIASFWQIIFPISGQIDALNDFFWKLLQAEHLFEILSYVNAGLNAAIYLPLAYYFFRQTQQLAECEA